MVYTLVVTRLDGIDDLQEDVFDQVVVPSERRIFDDRMPHVSARAVVEDDICELLVLKDTVYIDDVGVSRY